MPAMPPGANGDPAARSEKRKSHSAHSPVQSLSLAGRQNPAGRQPVEYELHGHGSEQYAGKAQNDVLGGTPMAR